MCVQPLFLRFLIVLFLCSIYHKTKYTPQIPNTSPPKYQIQSVSINVRATTVIPILNCPLRSIYLSIPILLFCRLLDTPKSNNWCFPNPYCSQSSSSYLSTDSVNNTRTMMRQGQFSFILYILVQCYLIYPQTVSITLEGWCAKGSLVFTTGNPLYIHVTFSRSFSVGRVVNFPKFHFILSAGPLGHPPITPLCSSNWAQDPGCPSPLLHQYTSPLAVIL